MTHSIKVRQQALAAYQTTELLSEIETRLGVNHTTVVRWAREHGLPHRYRVWNDKAAKQAAAIADWLAGEKTAYILAKFQIDKETFRQWRLENRVPPRPIGRPVLRAAA